MAGVVIVCNE